MCIRDSPWLHGDYDVASWAASGCESLAPVPALIWAPSEALGPDGAASALAGRFGRAAAGGVVAMHSLLPHMYV
eukprot:9479444-Pyramimonas_sp.AAC.1